MTKKNKEKKSGLGRGLDSLIPVVEESTDNEEENITSFNDVEEENNSILGDEVAIEKSPDEELDLEKVSKLGDEIANADLNLEEEISSDSDDITLKDEELKIIETFDEVLSEEEIAKPSEEVEILPFNKINFTENESSMLEIKEILDANKDELDLLYLVGEEDLSSDKDFEIDEEKFKEVLEVVEDNPRITLWSSKAAAVLRYLRKTEPEFSISNEASKLIEEAICEKYPELCLEFEKSKEE